MRLMKYISHALWKAKSKIINWLLYDIPIKQLHVLDLHVGQHSMKVTPTSIIFHPNSSDPSTVIGQLWYRSDSHQLVFNSGKGIARIALIRWGSGAPSGHAPAYTLYIDTSNEIMYYYNGESWIPLGAVYK